MQQGRNTVVFQDNARLLLRFLCNFLSCLTSATERRTGQKRKRISIMIFTWVQLDLKKPSSEKTYEDIT